MAEDDPREIRSVAVTTEDVVAAYEARRRSSRPAVLRVTPPFSGRMRARLHVAEGEGSGGEDDREKDGDTADELHVHPERFVVEDEVPAYPSPDDTEDELRADPEVEFSVERHRERHVEAVEEWRAAVVDAIAETVELPVEDGEAEVKPLG